MVIAAPRSGTAWCANWLSDGKYLCLHDPLWDHHYRDLDLFAGPQTGVACTGLGYFPEWVNQHPAPKVILHRPLHEINNSLATLGLPDCPPKLFNNLWKIDGLHVHWTSLFGADVELVHRHLRIGDFDPMRWSMLRDMNVTAKYERRRQDPDVWARLQADRAFS
jgi:hypothetical protein